MPTASSVRAAASRASRRGQAAQSGAGVDEIPAGHPFVEGVLLRAEADRAIEGGIVPDRLAEHANCSLAGAKLAGRQLQQRRLAGAVGAEQPGDAGADFERQLVDADDVAVPLGNFVEVDDGRHFSRSSDLIEKFRMHAESPNKTAKTAADQYQG